MAYLIFTSRQGKEIGRRPLDGPMVIGRSPECDVALDDAQLSRRHCRLMPSAEGWVLSDLDSRNGTRFRGPKISRHVLRDGDVFQIGLSNVLFRAGDMPTGAGTEKGVARPKRPASPFEAPEATEVGFRYEPVPPSHRRVEDFPVPIPIAVDLDWLDVDDELLPVDPEAFLPSPANRHAAQLPPASPGITAPSNGLRAMLGETETRASGSFASPPDIQKLVDERVQSGVYRTPEDVVAAALVHLDQPERLASLRADLNLQFPDSLRQIEDGVADADAGRLTDGEEFFAELEREEGISDPKGRKTA